MTLFSNCTCQNIGEAENCGKQCGRLEAEQAEPPRTVFCIIDTNNYYREPVTIRIFDSKEKAEEFCRAKPKEKYYWEEEEVE
jgi:hypothetical protein